MPLQHILINFALIIGEVYSEAFIAKTKRSLTRLRPSFPRICRNTNFQRREALLEKIKQGGEKMRIVIFLVNFLLKAAAHWGEIFVAGLTCIFMAMGRDGKTGGQNTAPVDL